MPATVEIGTPCFVRLNGRVYPGIVVGFWNDMVKGAAVVVETEAAREVRREWKGMSFWARDATGVAEKHATVIVPQDDEEREHLAYEVANPPADKRMQWLAQQAGELPLEHKVQREEDLVPQFPSDLDPKA